MRPRAVAVFFVVLTITACDSIPLNGAAPSIPNTCVVRADRPHLSSTALRKGQRTIIGKGWFQCTTPLQDASIRVEIQTRGTDGGWRFRAGDGDDHEPVKPRKKYLLPVEIPCVEGLFRTRARISAHDEVGQPSQSPWFESGGVTDPCGKG